MATPECSMASRWQTWRRLHPVYCALAREFVLESPPCTDLESVIDVPTAENVAEAEQWFAAMDNRIHIHHLRHFAQTSPLMTEQAVADFLSHTLAKPRKNAEDHDKVDFLAVQLLAMRLPPSASAPNPSLPAVMQLMESVVGSPSGDAPPCVKDLESMIAEADTVKNLNALFTSRIIERSREIKQSSGNDFFQPVALSASARFGYLVRRRFFELMQQDLNAILDGLRELERHGVRTIDCRRAQFGADEPISRIRMICQSWRVMFQAEYSSGQPLCLLVDLKTVVEQAVAQNQTTKVGPRQASTGAAAAVHN